MNREPIAIIGIGCRFPKANNPEAFWHLLLEGVDAITEMPPSRWDLDPDTEKLDKINTRWGGFLEQVDQFDPKFFGISSREAGNMDPQQRLLLEVTWEALEDAGQIPKHLAGTQTGVFIGISTQDFSMLTSGNSCQDIYTTIGTSHSIAANRISYALNFIGSSVAFDTACSSSLVAVHYACLSLWNQESTLAVAGGVNALLLPKVTANFAKAGFLAPDGRCKTFDARADGYVRGEGAGVVILKPLSQALADSDRIYAVIKGSAVNQDGRSNGLTAPNPQAQSAVLRSAYQLSGISPGQVQYIEAHGTGTSLGDPIEMDALGEVLSQDRPPGNYCAVGSVKTNIGHLEAAAGIAGLIKVALSLKHRQIPPSLHFQKPNPYIPFDKLPLRVQRTLSPWPQRNGLALAGISSFGFGGTNAHVVLAEAPPQIQNSKFKVQKDDVIERPVHLLTLSAKSEDALQELAQSYQEFLLNHPNVSLADVCFTANTGRTHFDYRLAVVAESKVQLQKELSAFTGSGETTKVVSGQVKSKKRPKVAFLFTGQGSQYIGMGRQLYETAPVFKQTLDRCDEILSSYLGKSLLTVLYPQAGETSLLVQTGYTQPALFAIEYALSQLWKSWGVVPTAVMGHSIGEYVAACVAGVFSLEDGLKLIASRSGLMQSLPPDGEMVVVFAASDTIRGITEINTEKVAFAAFNTPQNTVISGERQAVLSICTALEAEGIKTKKLQVSHAFHSPLMEPMQAEFHQIAASITYAAPQIDLISNLTAERLTKKDITPEYWARHLRECVRFADSLKTLHANNYDIFVEIGPKPTLLGMGRNCLPERVGVWLPSLRQGQDDWQLLLQSLGKLYTCGVPVDWSSFDRDNGRELISLPTYPWQRQRYWIETSEQRYQQAESLSGENSQSPITNLLEAGNIEQLAQLVQKVGNFSPEQIKLLPELLSVLFREHKQHLIPDFIQDLCYEVVWREQGSIQQHFNGKETKTESGSWLIFADNQGIAQHLSELLRSQKETCMLVFPGTEYKKIKEQQFSINPGLPEDFQKLLLERVPTDKTPWRGVVYLWSIDTVSADALTVADLEVASQTGCGGALSLVQSLIGKEFSQPPTLWLVTKGAQRVGVESTLVGIAQSPVWGLGKVITNEYPEFNCTLVDLDPGGNNNAQSLFAEICSPKPTSGDRVAFRNGQRYVDRLVRSDKIVKKSLQLKADATYLITGGLGGIGLLVAQWMVEHGAKHLVLVGRSSPNEAATATLSRLEEVGTQVVVIQTDVSKEEEVTSLLNQIKTSMPQLRGIIHTAGVVEDRLLVDHQWQLFAKVFAPKVSGAWNLHTLTQDLPLDFFVLFSSAASIFAPAGLANYAAANTFLDTLADYRRSLSLPGLSINWGPWSMVGMAKAIGSRGEVQWATKGIKPIESQQALRILENLLPQDAAQVGVMQVNWSKFLQQFSLSSYPNFVSEIAQQVQKSINPQEQEKVKSPQLLDQIKANSKDQSQSLLITYLREQIAKALGITTSGLNIDEPLNQMGLDSLMVIELRNRLRADLGVDIPIAKFLDDLSIVHLRKLVSEQLFETNSTSSYEAPEDVLTPELLTQIKQHKEEIIYLLQKHTDTAKTGPLSHRQKALWFLYQLAPLSAAYNLAYAARLVSNVDIPALRQAASALIERHSVLRTTYTAQHGEPVQTIQENQQVCFSVQEVANWSQDDLSNWLVIESDRPFDLSKGPVLRFHLLIKNTLTDASVAKEVILLMSAHHIVVDFWSLELLVSELRVFYEAFKTGQQIALPPQNLQYFDYVQWENQMLASQQGERLWNYWSDRLAGELPILNLPTERPRPPVQTYEGASYSCVFGEKPIHNLLELAKTEGVTLYIIILAAFEVLLLRYTNQEDILIGSPMAGRSLAEFEKIVGFFANPVVLRADLSGNPTFRDLLYRVRSCVLGALEHQDYPYALLVERLQPLRDPSRSPLDQVALVWDRSHQSEGQVSLMDSDGLIVESITPESKGTPFDLSLTIVDVTGSLKGIWTYNTDLFDGSTIEQMAGHFQTLLAGIVANPIQQIWQLPLLRQNERQQLLVEWNDTQKDYPQDKCIHQLFEEQVERTPDAVAVVFEDQQLTYRELNGRANQLAHYLKTLGVGPEVLVGICVERSLSMVVGLLGILKAGGAYVPLDPTYPSERLRYMLEDAGVQVLLTFAQLVESLPKHNARVVCLDTDDRTIALKSESNPISRVTSDNLAYVIYTSGSTGKPKGAMNTHLGICNRLLWMQETYQLTVADCVLQKTPFSFDVSVWEFFWPLLTGARLVVAKPGGHQDSAYLVNLTLEQQITTLHFVPSMLQVFLEEQGLESCSCLKRTFCSGEELPKKLQERFFARLGCELHNLYGPTEVAIDVTFWQCKPESNLRTVPIGRPIANTQIYILNPDLQPVPIGVPGELHISGAGLALGYLNRPETTAEKFIPNPFSSEPGSRLYRTGDLARYLADGNIEYLGRRDHQVKIRGFRIELGEIEAVLTQHFGVNSCCAIVREDTPGDKRLVAYVVLDTHTAVTKSELRSFLKTKLPEYMIPAAFVILESLPLTPNGKLDSRALPTPDTNGLPVETSFVPPLDIVEQKLAQIWAEVLNVYPVGVKDNFFDQGGHSLLAAQLMARIEQQFKKNLPLGTLFQNSTIERLATILRQPIDDLDWSALVPIQPNGSKRPFFCVPGAEGNTTYLYNLAHHLGKEQPFYGLQPVGLDGESKPHRRIEDMAAYYIETIQSIQPEGPYLLGGHSFGGMVAFEMATQLRQRGYEVALLALLDSSAPGYRTNKLDFDGDDAGWLNMIASVYENIYGKSLNVSEEALKVLAPDEQLNYFKQRLQMVSLLPPDVGIKQLRRMMQVFKTNYQSASVYMPQAIYPAQITFFKASEMDAVSNAYSKILDELGLDWDKFSAQPLDIHFVPGNHNTMLNEPHVQVLAKRLTIFIERSLADD